jgi:mannosyl-3-phosphoglycerate phosphatase
MSSTQLVIFTDLDGTMLDHDTYSCEVSKPAVEQLQVHDIPIVFCSAKTRAEQEVYRTALGIDDPFVVENGAALFIGQGYFLFEYDHHKRRDRYHVIELGKPYSYVANVLLQTSLEMKLVLQRYGTMSDQEVANITGLDQESAARARDREYEETVVTPLDSELRRSLEKQLDPHGLRITQGARFHGIGHVDSDKGRAVSILTDLFRRRYGSVTTVGLGDSFNDQAMLAAVDLPYLVKKSTGEWEKVEAPNLTKVDAIGPLGWVEVATDLLQAAKSDTVRDLAKKEDLSAVEGGIHKGT